MFTGLIQCTGEISAVENMGRETRIGLRPAEALDNPVVGESIAVNGVCLTVETISGSTLAFYASAETMSKTNLGALKPGSLVNLERAMALGDRLGGHMVSGHVDCLAKVDEVKPAGQSVVYGLSFPSEFGPLVVPKGSVALDGISLTVNECGPDRLSVNIIPETQRITNIRTWKPGSAGNMETDLIGKYVARMLAPWRESGDTPGAGKGLDMNFLKKHGF